MTEHRLPPSACTECGYVHDAASGVKLRELETDEPDENAFGAPRPGDFSVCIECAAINQYDSELKLGKPDLEGVDHGSLTILRASQVAITFAKLFRL